MSSSANPGPSPPRNTACSLGVPSRPGFRSPGLHAYPLPLTAKSCRGRAALDPTLPGVPSRGSRTIPRGPSPGGARAGLRPRGDAGGEAGEGRSGEAQAAEAAAGCAGPAPSPAAVAASVPPRRSAPSVAAGSSAATYAAMAASRRARSALRCRFLRGSGGRLSRVILHKAAKAPGPASSLGSTPHLANHFPPPSV